MEKSDKESQSVDNEIKNYKEKYHKHWWKKWVEDQFPTLNYDEQMKFINTAIYNKTWVRGIGHTNQAFNMYQMQEQRMLNLFGSYCHVENVYDKMSQPQIAEILISDAIKTGKWEELPDKLQIIYKKRINKC